MKRLLLFMPLLLAGCGGYEDFSLPVQPGAPANVRVEWRPFPDPLLAPGRPGEWDSSDVLNPSVVKEPSGYLNLYSGFDGASWRTGAAASPDGLHWTKQGVILASEAGRETDNYIAANGGTVRFQGALLYFFQSGRTPAIRLARRQASGQWNREPAAVLEPGPYGSWDELGVADPYVIEAGGRLYLFYLGMDRARRQRLGVAQSTDGVAWDKLRANPILELGEYGAFDGNGLGEPAVWSALGCYWMLYTGRARDEQRSLGLARSNDGVHWSKLAGVILRGQQPWNSRVLCDPTVLLEGGRIRVWFGGGDVARPDERIHGRIGYAELNLLPQ